MNIPEDFAQINYFFVGAAVPRGAQIAIGVAANAEPPLTVAGLCRDAFVDNIMPLLPEVVTLEKVKAKLGPNDTGAEASIVSGEPGGMAATEPMSPNVAILVTKNNAIGGRSNQGKMFIPAFPEDDTDGGGLLIAARLIAWQAACSAFLSDLETAGHEMYILHTNPLLPPTLVTDLGVEQKLATQKRRLRRAGGRRTPTP